MNETDPNGYKPLEAEMVLLLETDLLAKLQALLSAKA
jgi:hypothetical protein